MHGIVEIEVQDPNFRLIKAHRVVLSPLIQAGQIPLQTIPSVQLINTPAQPGLTCKLMRKHTKADHIEFVCLHNEDTEMVILLILEHSQLCYILF